MDFNSRGAWGSSTLEQQQAMTNYFNSRGAWGVQLKIKAIISIPWWGVQPLVKFNSRGAWGVQQDLISIPLVRGEFNNQEVQDHI